jgi:hypothetical protein
MPSAIESSQIECVSSQFVTTNATPFTAPGANKVAQLRRNWVLAPGARHSNAAPARQSVVKAITSHTHIAHLAPPDPGGVKEGSQG